MSTLEADPVAAGPTLTPAAEEVPAPVTAPAAVEEEAAAPAETAPEPAAPSPPPPPPAPVAEAAPAEAEPIKAEPTPVEPKVEDKPQPSDQEVKARLAALLETADLSTMSVKQLRKTLEDEFGVSLKERKELINDEANAFVAAQQAAEPAAEENEEAAEDAAAEGEDGDEAAPPPAKKAKKAKAGKKKAGKASGGMEPALSPELAAFVGAPRMHRFKIVKAIWVYIKAHDLQDPADKRSILPDAKLGTILTAPVTMFSMNRQLNAHIIKEG